MIQKKGSVFIDENSIKDFKISELRKFIGYVPQSGFLFLRNNQRKHNFGSKGKTKNDMVEVSKKACVHDNIMMFKKIIIP